MKNVILQSSGLLLVITLSMLLCGKPQNENFGGGGIRTFVSDEFSFSLHYPERFGLKQYGPESFVLTAGDEFRVEFDVLDIDEWHELLLSSGSGQAYSDDRFVNVVLDRAIAYCAADGPDGSYQASEPRIVEDGMTRNGFRSVKLYLTGTLINYNENSETSQRIGPFYGIQFLVQEKPYALLVRYKRQELAPAADENMMKAIVQSFSSIKTEGS